jgi:hypothetical protein
MLIPHPLAGAQIKHGHNFGRRLGSTSPPGVVMATKQRCFVSCCRRGHTNCLTAPRLVCLPAPLVLLSNMVGVPPDPGSRAVPSLGTATANCDTSTPQTGSCDPARHVERSHTLRCHHATGPARTAAVDRLTFRDCVPPFACSGAGGAVHCGVSRSTPKPCWTSSVRSKTGHA